MRTEEPRVIHLSDYQPPAYRILSVALHFKLEPQATRVTTTMEIEAVGEGGAPLALHGDDLSLDHVAVDGVALDAAAYSHDAAGLTLYEPPARFTLETQTQIAPASNTALEGLYMSSGKYCTQCEAEGFRRITFYPDRPDVLSVYTVTIDADRETCPVLLSNGNLIEETALENGRHRAVWHDPFPKPSYLFALVAGDLGLETVSFRLQVLDLGVQRTKLCALALQVRADGRPPLRQLLQRHLQCLSVLHESST